MGASITPYPGKIRHHDCVWALDMSNPALIASLSMGVEHLSAVASGLGCACVHVTAGAAGQFATYTTTSVLRPLETIRGRIVYVRYNAKATALVGALRVLINYESVSEGPNSASGRGDSVTAGTYDWTEHIQSVELPADAVIASVWIGATEGSGEAWIRDLRMTAMHSFGYAIPEIDTSWQPVQQNIRGFNIGGLLPYTETDYQRLGSRYRCNVIRWMLFNRAAYDPTDMASYADMFAAEIADLRIHIEYARANGIKILLNIGMPPGGRAAAGVGFPTEYLSAWYSRFISDWQWLANEFKDEPVIWAFDLVNEPAYTWQTPYEQGPGDMNWWKLIHDAIRAIRAIDPNRICVVEHDAYTNVKNYQWLEPWPFNNLIYSPHFYSPNPYNTDANLDGHIVYPGGIGEAPGTIINKEYLRQLLQPARDFQLRYKVPIFVGEFAVYRTAPGAAQYLRELIELFEEYRWMWAYFVYSDWSIVNPETLPQVSPDVRVDTILDRGQALIDAMATNRTWSDL